MPLPSDYLELLEVLALAFADYEARTGSVAVLVGGAAAAIQTDGAFMSGDFDIVAADDDAFCEAIEAAGFVPDERVGKLRGGWFHPDFPAYGVEQVSGALFDGRSDNKRLIRLTAGEGMLILPAVEDLIADRLGQHAIASTGDDSRLQQARLLLKLAQPCTAP